MMTNVINEETMNNGRKLSEDQINRIVMTVAMLANKSNNAQAITLAHNLKMSKDIEEKRKWILLFYVSCFQLLSFINMGRDKEMELEEYKIELSNLFKVPINGKK